MRRLALIIMAAALCCPAAVQAKKKAAPQPVLREYNAQLYEGEIPNNRPNAKVTTITGVHQGDTTYVNTSHPLLQIIMPAPEKNQHTAIVLCPGGAYRGTSHSFEGKSTAKLLIEQGITVLLLDYRIPSDSTQIDKTIAPLQDAQAAIIYARTHAQELDIDPTHVGVMGFSAGGHLASTALTHYQKCLVPNPQNVSVRPDFGCLVYPVITFEPGLRHDITAKCLVGDNLPEAKVQLYSNHKQVTDDTPPTFLTHAGDDKGVPVKNSIMFYEAMLQHNRPAELYIMDKGDHTFNLRANRFDWLPPFYTFLKSHGYIK